MEKISQWFKANKLSINIKETKFTLFQKNSFKDEIPLKLPVLMIGNNNIQRKSSMKLLGVLLDEQISWNDHVRTVKNKITKNIGLLHRVSEFLNEDSLKTVYLSYINSYLNYTNIAWASYVCNEIEKSLFETKTCSTHCT